MNKSFGKPFQPFIRKSVKSIPLFYKEIFLNWKIHFVRTLEPTS